jgi:hypothetical protein
MKVYTLGDNLKSKTCGKVLVTIELLPMTDMKGIKLYHGKLLVNPFYRELKVNCGKITNITDLNESYDFTVAELPFNKGVTTVEDGKYFNINQYNFKTEECITAYQYKIAAAEQANYVQRNYSGTYDTHYQSGFIRIRTHYVNGEKHAEHLYRNDAYNTLEGVRMYNQGHVECEFVYDGRETLIRQTWYNSKGDVFSEKIAANLTSVRASSVSETVIDTKPVPTANDESLSGSGSSNGSLEDAADDSADAEDEDSGEGNSPDNTCGKGEYNLRLKPHPDDDVVEVNDALPFWEHEPV